ncbi:hypothetical protein TNCV_2984091 [Trichonephila clavipes]|nr:hypothetical protein TNCV_2984091 [Trichonephila clavipes]
MPSLHCNDCSVTSPHTQNQLVQHFLRSIVTKEANSRPSGRAVKAQGRPIWSTREPFRRPSSHNQRGHFKQQGRPIPEQRNGRSSSHIPGQHSRQQDIVKSLMVVQRVGGPNHLKSILEMSSVVKHGVKHHILTTGQPVYSKARQLAPDKLKLAKQEFQFMLDNIIRPSKSQWASPLLLVNMKDGTLRPCGDYRRLNAQTIPDRYSIPRIEDFNYILKDKKIFSKIDLVKAYYQIPIAEEDKEKTAITTSFGLYEFNTMSFGLRNAPSTFQRFITEVLYGLDFVFPYHDDVLIDSSTEEEHSEHLKMVFERFQQYGLRINVSKSVMGAAQVEYLGFLITAEGSRPLPEKVQAIFNCKLPETIHDLGTFLWA